MGDPVGVGCRPITFLGARNRAEAARVRMQCGPEGGLGGRPLDLGMPSLRLAGVARPSFGCPHPS
jgi:hypothetical protein